MPSSTLKEHMIKSAKKGLDSMYRRSWPQNIEVYLILDYLKSLSDSIDCIDTFALVFNTKTISIQFKISYPKRCYTRLLIFFDICSWMVIHYNQIELFLIQELNLKLSTFHKND